MELPRQEQVLVIERSNAFQQFHVLFFICNSNLLFVSFLYQNQNGALPCLSRQNIGGKKISGQIFSGLQNFRQQSKFSALCPPNFCPIRYTEFFPRFLPDIPFSSGGYFPNRFDTFLSLYVAFNIEDLNKTPKSRQKQTKKFE